MKTINGVDAVVWLRQRNWDSVDPSLMPLDEWIALARDIRASRVERSPQLVARIQMVVTQAGLIDDAGFVDRLTA